MPSKNDLPVQMSLPLNHLHTLLSTKNLFKWRKFYQISKDIGQLIKISENSHYKWNLLKFSFFTTETSFLSSYQELAGTYSIDCQWCPRERPLRKTPKVSLEGSEGSFQGIFHLGYHWRSIVYIVFFMKEYKIYNSVWNTISFSPVFLKRIYLHTSTKFLNEPFFLQVPK